MGGIIHLFIRIDGWNRPGLADPPGAARRPCRYASQRDKPRLLITNQLLEISCDHARLC